MSIFTILLILISGTILLSNYNLKKAAGPLNAEKKAQLLDLHYNASNYITGIVLILFFLIVYFKLWAIEIATPVMFSLCFLSLTIDRYKYYRTLKAFEFPENYLKKHALHQLIVGISIIVLFTVTTIKINKGSQLLKEAQKATNAR